MPKNISQKIIASLMIFGLVLSTGFNLLIFKPKQAQALDAGGSWATAIKETVLDAVGWAFSDMILKPMEQKIMNWGLGKNTDANIPFPVSDWVKFFRDAVDRGAANFITEYEQAFDLSDQFQSSIKSFLDSLGLGTYPGDLSPYSEYARPTLKEDLEKFGIDYQGFIDSGYSLAKGGWAGWFSMMKPENNIFGQAMMAEQEKLRQMTEAKEAADKETAVSGGVRNETTTTETDTDACKKNCINVLDRYDYCYTGGMVLDCTTSQDCGACGGGSSCLNGRCLLPNSKYGNCMTKCETTKKGIPISTKIKNFGADIRNSLNNAMGADLQRIISADEISELIGIIFSSLLNKTIDGLGLAFSAKNATDQEQNRAKTNEQYSYYSNALDSQTPADIREVRTNILTTILKGVQSLSKSITDCNNDDAIMNEREFSRNLSDISEAELQALYAGIARVNIKPDFEVLDPLYAPFSLYGYSWGQIPPNKIPSKCRNVINQYYTDRNLAPRSETTCKNITSGLEPNYDSKCGQCLYDDDATTCPPAPVPPIQPYGFQIPQETWNQKVDFYNNCKGWYLVVQDRCSECMKKADEKCNQETQAEKQECINNYCGNYEDLALHVTSKIKDGMDFYNKCLIEEKKGACFTCLREYFVPANYCDQINDYMARAIVKYPTLLLRSSDETKNMVGREDGTCTLEREAEVLQSQDRPLERKPLELALICRIIPDFTNDAGQNVCQKFCFQGDMTQEELNEITDFRPYGIDCGDKTLNIGGKINVWNLLRDGIFNIRGKCCAALWQGDSGRYADCRGTEIKKPCTFGLPVDQEPWCYCPEGYRPLGFTRTGSTANGEKAPLGGDCANTNISKNSDLNLTYVYSNNDPFGTDMFFIATGECSEDDELVNNTDLDDDGVADGTPTDAHAPSGVIWSAETTDDRTDWWISIPAGDYYAGAYHNDNNDVSSGIHVCEQCNGQETGYPKYGTEYDQCFGKAE